ncbi:MAG: ATP-grasp domain-containing protein [Treponema sp.]|nr:ATP-grasp domain-containing protein [Treponema sp.]
MRILFYSTSSNIYNGESVTTTTLPSFTTQWDNLSEQHSEHEFLIATQLPALFLCDVHQNSIEQSEKIKRILIKSDKEKEIAEELSELKPDLAIAASFYVTPYDWLTIKDAMVADFLRKKGIRTICHNVETSVICFDKWRTHLFLEKSGINCAKAVYMHHELWINGGNRHELKSNVFRDSVFHEVQKLKFPVIIKDTTGLSSFGADVVHNFDEATGILKSKKTTSDRIIEEMIPGEQFGCEIYGTYDEKSGHGQYSILPPFKFSVNQYGITSPKQSVKFGPFGITEEESAQYKIPELKKMLQFLAAGMKLNGISQVDLVFDGEKWFVIEVNPRLSGMSTTYAASAGVPLSSLIFKGLEIKNTDGESLPPASNAKAFSASPSPRGIAPKTPDSNQFFFEFIPTLNIKFPILENRKLLELKALPYVAFVNQIENHAARQIREQGYCEVILCGKTREELLGNLIDLRDNFKDSFEEEFFNKAVNLIKK